jgi:hypothetical protein
MRDLIEALRTEAWRKHEAETQSYINRSRIGIVVTFIYRDGSRETLKG